MSSKKRTFEVTEEHEATDKYINHPEKKGEKGEKTEKEETDKELLKKVHHIFGSDNSNLLATLELLRYRFLVELNQRDLLILVLRII